MKKETSTIRVSKETKDILKDFGNFGDNWNDCIINLHKKYMLVCEQYKLDKQKKLEELKKPKKPKKQQR